MRRNEGDGHGKLHRPAAFKDVLERFFEDGVAAHQTWSQPNHTDAVEWFPARRGTSIVGGG
jgi:hypothetical protein